MNELELYLAVFSFVLVTLLTLVMRFVIWFMDNESNTPWTHLCPERTRK